MPTRIFLDETPLRLQADESMAEAILLPLDLSSLLSGTLKRFPPSTYALETAIAAIEDSLMPAIPALRHYPLELLQGEGRYLHELATVVGHGLSRHVLRLSIDELERVFNRVVDVAAGMPARSVQIPESLGFVATVLVLREVMHHAGYLQLEFSSTAQPD